MPPRCDTPPARNWWRSGCCGENAAVRRLDVIMIWGTFWLVCPLRLPATRSLRRGANAALSCNGEGAVSGEDGHGRGYLMYRPVGTGRQGQVERSLGRKHPSVGLLCWLGMWEKTSINWLVECPPTVSRNHARLFVPPSLRKILLVSKSGCEGRCPSMPLIVALRAVSLPA